MKTFVTGGAGFIGSNFIRHVLSLSRGEEVVNYDKLTHAGNLANLAEVAESPCYSFVRGDVCDGVAVEEAMRGCDTVIHFAAESHVDRSIYEPAPIIETNVTGTSSSAWPEAGGSLMTTMVQLMLLQSSLFHGSPSTRLEWHLFGSEALTRKLRVRVIIPDRPGLGRSDFQPGRQISDWPADVIALADHRRLTVGACSTRISILARPRIGKQLQFQLGKITNSRSESTGFNGISSR